GPHPHRIVRVVEPQTHMVKLDRISRWIRRSIRKRLVVEHNRGRRRARRHYKGLYAETTDEDFMTDALAIGLDIALVPGKAKRCLRYLDDEEIKVSVRRQPRYYNVHDFDWTDGFDLYMATCVGQRVLQGPCVVAHHVEFKDIGQSRRGCQGGDCQSGKRSNLHFGESA